VAHGPRGAVSRVDPQFGTLIGTTNVAGTAFGSPNGSITLDHTSAWAVFGDSTLAHLDAAGNVLGTRLAGIQPAGVASASGSIWVTNSGEANVQRFNAATFTKALRSYSVGVRPTGVIYSEGAIWVASTDDEVVTRIDPARARGVDIPVGAGPQRWRVPPDRYGYRTRPRVPSPASTRRPTRWSRRSRSETPRQASRRGGLLWVAVQAA
jgi:DNA-binding beta-propeller fold protein YncE